VDKNCKTVDGPTMKLPVPSFTEEGAGMMLIWAFETKTMLKNSNTDKHFFMAMS
jgi:hypothetical protein